MRYLTLLFVSLILLPAQEAVVVPLKDADADLMRSLYKQRADLDIRIEMENARIGKLYATWDPGYARITSDGPQPPPFEYSRDFKYIVPKKLDTSGYYFSVGPDGTLHGTGSTQSGDGSNILRTPVQFGCGNLCTNPMRGSTTYSVPIVNDGVSHPSVWSQWVLDNSSRWPQ